MNAPEERPDVEVCEISTLYPLVPPRIRAAPVCPASFDAEPHATRAAVAMPIENVERRRVMSAVPLVGESASPESTARSMRRAPRKAGHGRRGAPAATHLGGSKCRVARDAPLRAQGVHEVPSPSFTRQRD